MSDVPTTLEQVLDPAWLSGALDDIDERDRIVAVEEVDASQTLAQKVRFRVTVEGADGTRRTRAYCVKAHLDGSPGADLLSEGRFYGELAPQLDVRMPRAYFTAVDDDAQQAMIIMDDVVANGGHFLNAHTPYSPDTARDTLGQLARLHAATWGCTDVADLTWLSPRITGMADIFPLDALQALLDDGRGPDVAPELRVGRQRGRGDAAHRRARDHVRDPRRSALGQLVPRRGGPGVLARLADRAARQLGDRHQLPPRHRPRRRDAARPGSRAPPPLPPRARVARRAGTVVGRSVGAVHA